MNFRRGVEFTDYVYFKIDKSVDTTEIINYFKTFELNFSDSEVKRALNKVYTYMAELTAEEKTMYSGCLYYDLVDNKLISGLFLNKVPSVSGEYTVHENTLVLGPSACKQNGFTSVHLPKSVQLICSFCFDNCAKLTSINLEDVAYIEPAAFAYCLELQRVKLSKVRAIGQYAFRFCTSLSSVEKNLKCASHRDAFSYCSVLER